MPKLVQRGDDFPSTDYPYRPTVPMGVTEHGSRPPLLPTAVALDGEMAAWDGPPMLDVLVTMRFNETQLDRVRAVSPDVRVTCADAGTADYARTDVLYAGAPPRDLSRAPNLKWVQVHMAGVNALYDHPLYADSAIPLTTTSGVHAGTIAEYAITVLLYTPQRSEHPGGAVALLYIPTVS